MIKPLHLVYQGGSGFHSDKFLNSDKSQLLKIRLWYNTMLCVAAPVVGGVTQEKNRIGGLL